MMCDMYVMGLEGLSWGLLALTRMGSWLGGRGAGVLWYVGRPWPWALPGGGGVAYWLGLVTCVVATGSGRLVHLVGWV